MKKIVLLILMAGLWSCSVDDSPNDEFYLEILPIKTVEGMPESVSFNEIYTVQYTFERPTSCHVYNDLYYLADGTTRTIAVIATVFNETGNTVCQDLQNEDEQRSFTFQVTHNAGTMVFQFWKGENEQGEDEYLIYEIPIQ